MISKLIKFMRLSSGYSQEQLAKRVHLASSTISGYEIGNSMPNFDTVENIANACDFEIAFFDKNSGERITKKDLLTIKD